MENLTPHERALLLNLTTPIKIQDFLDTLAFNNEASGETCMSPIRVLRERKAHCLEGALLAATALWLQGRDTYIVNLKVKKSDYDHIIVLYKEHGYFGALSKTNHNVLRFRDPLYKNIHELVMSYFHEYFLEETGEKTLLGYTKPINIKKFGTAWICKEEDLWDIAEKIYDTPIIEIIPKENRPFIRNACKTEMLSAGIREWK